VRRREFISLLGGAAAAAWPLAARAQQGDRVRRIGVLSGVAESDLEGEARIASLRQALQELGWTEGQNIRIDYRWAGGDANRARTYAAELVQLAPDAIVANSSTVVAALKAATGTIPIIFVGLSQPLELGLVASLAHPGGNITGFTQFEPSMSGKWLEIIKEATPHLRRVMIILNSATPSSGGYWRAAEAVSPVLGLQLSSAWVNSTFDMERAISDFAQERNGSIVVPPSILAVTNRELIVALANRQRLPAIYPYRVFAAEGGLMSYGIDTIDPWRRAGSYVNRILKGEQPADLPVQQPTKFELVINLKTAKAIGLDVPPMLLGRADEVIE
jgi:putative tryptophan/tyrosine transport system substrate-binding protein